MTHGLNNMEIFYENRPTGVVMFETPSPASIIFVLPEGTATKLGRTEVFKDIKSAMHACPTAYQLLAQKDSGNRPLITQISVGDHETAKGRAYLTVTLANTAQWRDRVVFGVVQRKILDFLKSGKKLLNADALGGEKKFPQLKAMFMAAGDRMDVAEHKAIIEIYNKIVVGTHGGTITYLGYDAGTKRLRVNFEGACNTCLAATATVNGLQGQMTKAHEAGIISREVKSIEVLQLRA